VVSSPNCLFGTVKTLSGQTIYVRQDIQLLQNSFISEFHQQP
jgi:hypothetical protein